MGSATAVATRPVRLLVAAKVLLAALLLTGALYPHGPFEGKGMAYRLPAFLAPGLIVSWRWWRHRGARPYPVALDAALTLPFLFDTMGNALGLFDSVTHFDSVLHALNWAVLCGGVTLAMAHAAGADATPPYRVLAGAGFGAIAIVLWEAMEYAVMEAGVAGLHLTYRDTISDLLVSMAGGAVGAWWAVRRSTRRQRERFSTSSASSARS